MSMTAPSLDRFSQGLQDAQNIPPVAQCACGCGEIYPGTVFQDAGTGKLYAEPWCAPAGSETMAMEINSRGEIGA